MWPAIATVLLMLGVPGAMAAVAPADCAADPGATSELPLALNLGGLTGVPKGIGGQAYIGVPFNSGGTVCDPPPPPPPSNILEGEPGNVLEGPYSPDLLRGPGTPRVLIMPP